MKADWRLSLLCGFVVLLIVVQQLASWRRWKQSAADAGRERSHIVELANQGAARLREQVRKGAIWLGELHERTEQVVENSSIASGNESKPAARRIVGRMDSGKESLSILYDLHECTPGSALCTSGGVLTVVSRDQPICVISVGLLQTPQPDGQQSSYRVTWENGTDENLQSDSQRLSLLQRLAGTTPAPDREQFERLLNAAYFGAPSAELPSESVEKQILCGILQAIVSSHSPGKSRP